jgi:hypothetical protein
MRRAAITPAHFAGDLSAAADFMGPGAIEVNRYQTEIFDLVRRRYVFGQRINQVAATGHPSRYFEQLSIGSAGFTDPRAINPSASQPSRVERPVMLKAIVSQLNYGIFDVEVNQQQGLFAYLEAKDLTDQVDAVLKLHDQALWTGSDTDLVLQTTTQYFGVSGQIQSASDLGGFTHINAISSTGSLVDGVKDQVATIASRTDFEVKPSALYLNPVFANLFDREAKTVQLYMNEVEVIPGVIVKAIPTQVGLIPLIPDPSISNLPSGAQTQYTGFIMSEEFVEYHWLTSPVPRVFQLGLLGNLAAQFVILKFGSVVAKGAGYAHAIVRTTR